jgi:hypothetical protein
VRAGAYPFGTLALDIFLAVGGDAASRIVYACGIAFLFSELTGIHRMRLTLRAGLPLAGPGKGDQQRNDQEAG